MFSTLLVRPTLNSYIDYPFFGGTCVSFRRWALMLLRDYLALMFWFYVPDSSSQIPMRRFSSAQKTSSHRCCSSKHSLHPICAPSNLRASVTGSSRIQIKRLVTHLDIIIINVRFTDLPSLRTSRLKRLLTSQLVVWLKSLAPTGSNQSFRLAWLQ